MPPQLITRETNKDMIWTELAKTFVNKIDFVLSDAKDGGSSSGEKRGKRIAVNKFEMAQVGV